MRSIRRRRTTEDRINEPVENLIELADIIGYDDGIIFVRSNKSLYFFDVDSTEDPDGVTVIAPALGDGRWIAVGSNGTSPVNHESLQGLQGGAEGDHKHLTASERLRVPTTEEEALLEEGVAAGGYRYKWSQKDTIEADEDVLIDEGEQLILHGELTVDGDLEVVGDLFLIDLDEMGAGGGNSSEVSYKVEAFTADEFDYNEFSGTSTVDLGAVPSTTNDLINYHQLLQNGVDDMDRVSGTPSQAGEWRLDGASLEVFGNVPEEVGTRFKFRYATGA